MRRRDLPSVDERARGTNDPLAVAAAGRVLARARETIGAGGSRGDLAASLRAELHALRAPRLRRVLNATGVIVHTNLGRAPLAAEALERVVEAARGYSNLEYDLADGRRGSRQEHVADALRRLTGAEAALVVNNNAAAVLLALAALAEGREVVVSRGELIEIGDGFRIPDVLARSGARLREVGTTNRTRASDYERAIGPETALLLRVHQSNFRVIGFTEQPRLEELVVVGRSHGLPVVDDLGSGALFASNRLRLADEPTARESLATGADRSPAPRRRSAGDRGPSGRPLPARLPHDRGDRGRRGRSGGPAMSLVGTAGHIDHGKTWLVRALTGKDTDRLPEERERGISIDLGYAPLELPGGRRLSLIDVPGHERFVRNMVAGAAGVRLFLLLVDAGG